MWFLLSIVFLGDCPWIEWLYWINMTLYIYVMMKEHRFATFEIRRKIILRKTFRFRGSLLKKVNWIAVQFQSVLTHLGTLLTSTPVVSAVARCCVICVFDCVPILMRMMDFNQYLLTFFNCSSSQAMLFWALLGIRKCLKSGTIDEVCLVHEVIRSFLHFVQVDVFSALVTHTVLVLSAMVVVLCDISLPFGVVLVYQALCIGALTCALMVRALASCAWFISRNAQVLKGIRKEHLRNSAFFPPTTDEYASFWQFDMLRARNERIIALWATFCLPFVATIILYYGACYGSTAGNECFTAYALHCTAC